MKLSILVSLFIFALSAGAKENDRPEVGATLTASLPMTIDNTQCKMTKSKTINWKTVSQTSYANNRVGNAGTSIDCETSSAPGLPFESCAIVNAINEKPTRWKKFSCKIREIEVTSARATYACERSGDQAPLALVCSESVIDYASLKEVFGKALRIKKPDGSSHPTTWTGRSEKNVPGPPLNTAPNDAGKKSDLTNSAR